MVISIDTSLDGLKFTAIRWEFHRRVLRHVRWQPVPCRALQDIWFLRQWVWYARLLQKKIWAKHPRMMSNRYWLPIASAKFATLVEPTTGAVTSTNESQHSNGVTWKFCSQPSFDKLHTMATWAIVIPFFVATSSTLIIMISEIQYKQWHDTGCLPFQNLCSAICICIAPNHTAGRQKVVRISSDDSRICGPSYSPVG